MPRNCDQLLLGAAAFHSVRVVPPCNRLYRTWKPPKSAPCLPRRAVHSEFSQRALLFGLPCRVNREIHSLLLRVRFNLSVPYFPFQFAEPLRSRESSHSLSRPGNIDAKDNLLGTHTIVRCHPCRLDSALLRVADGRVAGTARDTQPDSEGLRVNEGPLQAESDAGDADESVVERGSAARSSGAQNREGQWAEGATSSQ